MRYKLLLLFFAPLLLFSQENGILKEYDRSSLSVMMIFHPEDEFAHNICEAFFTMPFPDKYDNHNQSIRIIDYNTFCNVKDKNETYAFRSSDTTIMKNNQLFYDTLCQNSLMLKSAHHKEAYCNHIRRIIKKNYYCPIKILQNHKIRADFICEVSPFSLDSSRQTIKSNYGQKYTF